VRGQGDAMLRDALGLEGGVCGEQFNGLCLGIGQNGIAVTADERHLLTVKYAPARLMRIGLQATSDVSEVTLHNDTGETIAGGADDVTLLNGVAYIALDTMLVRATPRDDMWTDADVAIHRFQLDDGTALTGVSGVTVAEDALYVSKSDVILYAAGIPPTTPFRLHRVEPTVFDAP